MSIPIPSETGTCLITGASAGIGTEFARQMADRGYNVTLAARRIDLLTELAAELQEKHNVRAIAVACDVTDAVQRQELLESIEARGDHVEILINNAGVGTDGSFMADPLETQLQQLEVNVVALTALTHMVLPPMLEKHAGAIMNVASTAGFQPMPRQAVYAATKAYVLSLSQGLSQEFKGTGVTFTALCPGPTRTEFFGERQQELENDSPDWAWQSAEDCARAGIDAMFRQKRVYIPKAVNKIGAYSGKLAPTRMTLEVLDRVWPVGK
ncbi:MAG: SDR family NAD(P)-dependent oxidoreductase [Solirubrobacterales bacterium]